LMVGIVGKPNTGKSTFFSAATLAPVEIGSYPFTTIKPNRGIAYVRSPCVCKEFNVQDNPVNSICLDGIRLIPVELIDCAGLVPGAWQGRGLGNQFLDEIRKADALIHIVDASGATDSEGKLCKPGAHDPLEDVRFLETEITMWLAQILKRDWPKLARTAESGKKDLLYLLEERLSGLAIRRNHIFETVRKTELNAEKPASWSDEDLIKFLDTLRSIAKPMLIAANKIDVEPAEENYDRLKNLDYIVIPCCAEAELAVRRAAEKKLIDYRPGDCNFNVLEPKKLTGTQSKALQVVKEKILQEFGSTGVQEAINMAFLKLLNMIVVYPIEDIERLSDHRGRVLPDAYIVPYGTTARQLAYIIHTELDVVSIISAKKRA